MEKIRVFVGVDRSQLLAVKVLEYSIRRHTKHPVEVFPMLDLPLPVITDVKNTPRTGFSYARFMIPDLAGRTGRAIYMDADMLVFKDISEIWNLPFNGSTIIIQKDLTPAQSAPNKPGAPKQRIRQCAVMMIDCEAASNWDIKNIIDDLNSNKYSYADLMFELCLVPDQKISQTLPFEWNSIEHFDNHTANIHYTDMNTQPWVFSGNPNGDLWFKEVRLMIKAGHMRWREVISEIRLGYFRPSLAIELAIFNFVPQRFKPSFHKLLNRFDSLLNYKKHAKVYAEKKRRDSQIELNHTALLKEKVESHP